LEIAPPPTEKSASARAVGEEDGRTEEENRKIKGGRRGRRRSSTRSHRQSVYSFRTALTLIEGPTGIAADCGKIIRDFAQAHPDQADRTLALIGRAGALYPFFRSSALLRHLDGNTDNVPVVLLYPGERIGLTGLSFMGVLNSDNDYRPRIYP
jgi:hypothetical protein